MKFLIDAQLPKTLSLQILELGHEALHTLDLPGSNRTTDSEISSLSLKHSWIVVTKDSDFVDSFLLRREPWKLLLISTGNIRNSKLSELILRNVDKITLAFETFDFIEINSSGIVYHSLFQSRPADSTTDTP